jgi:hypothetical protein
LLSGELGALHGPQDLAELLRILVRLELTFNFSTPFNCASLQARYKLVALPHPLLCRCVSCSDFAVLNESRRMIEEPRWPRDRKAEEVIPDENRARL